MQPVYRGAPAGKHRADCQVRRVDLRTVKFLYYSLVRLAIMVIVFVVCALLHTGLVLAAVFAILIGFAVGYLAFPKLHAAATRDLMRAWSSLRGRKKTTAQDETAADEDEYVEEQLRREGRDV